MNNHGLTKPPKILKNGAQKQKIQQQYYSNNLTSLFQQTNYQMNNSQNKGSKIFAMISMVTNIIITPFLFTAYISILLIRSLFTFGQSLIPKIIGEKIKVFQEIGNDIYMKLRRVLQFVLNISKNKQQYEQKLKMNEQKLINDEIKQNQKIITLENKIRSLQQSRIKETNEKKEIQEQLSKIQYECEQRNEALCKVHDENVDSKMRVNVLENDLKNVNEELQKQKMNVNENEQKLKNIEEQLKMLKNQLNKQNSQMGNQKIEGQSEQNKEVEIQKQKQKVDINENNQIQQKMNQNGNQKKKNKKKK